MLHSRDSSVVHGQSVLYGTVSCSNQTVLLLALSLFNDKYSFVSFVQMIVRCTIIKKKNKVTDLYSLLSSDFFFLFSF